MLRTLEVDNYQSLRSVRLQLGKFTVVTGPTGSGKSALVRAIQLLAFNAPGTSFISRGAKTASVRAGITEPELADGWSVGIERGGRGKDSYVLAPPGVSDAPAVYTKLARKVPDDVSALLRLSPLNFSGQFDRPFLLDDSGGEIARVLGELTNVTLIFNAAREANRRRLRLKGQLDDAVAELGRLRDDVQRFRGLRQRTEAVAQASAALESYQCMRDKILRFQAAVVRLEAAQEVLSRAVVPEVLDTSRMDELLARQVRLRELTAGLAHSMTSRSLSAGTVNRLIQDEHQERERLRDTLVRAGVCPTCGSPITAGHSLEA
jgi:DNA repair protein SbcC/Rad50